MQAETGGLFSSFFLQAFSVMSKLNAANGIRLLLKEGNEPEK